MSCYNCAKEFGFLNREKACKNCGFGFCSKCLGSKAKLPATGKVEPVCKACFKLLTQPESKERPMTPPSALERRLQHLENPPPAKPIVVYRGSQKMNNLRKGLSVEDQRIVDRLERLHQDRKRSEQLPTDREMADRLARLKGVPERTVGPSEGGQSGGGFYHRPETRPPAARADDLMQRMGEEVGMDTRHQAEDAELTDEIAERLARLRGVGVDPAREGAEAAAKKTEQAAPLDDGEELPSDEEADRLVDQLMEEAKLEAAQGGGGAEEMDADEPPPIDNKMSGLVRQLTRDLHQVQDEDEEELPWCGICNEDAELRCRDCDGDLFCQRCFVECHNEFDVKHRREAYSKKPKQHAG